MMTLRVASLYNAHVEAWFDRARHKHNCPHYQWRMSRLRSLLASFSSLSLPDFWNHVSPSRVYILGFWLGYRWVESVFHRCRDILLRQLSFFCYHDGFSACQNHSFLLLSVKDSERKLRMSLVAPRHIQWHVYSTSKTNTSSGRWSILRL